MALPFRLHANAPQWVPPLKIERRLFLNRHVNAFFKHGEAQLFLARRDGRVVGRISAHVDHAYNRQHESRWGWFGFFECEDDQEAVDALLAAAEAWNRGRGFERMVGPADFTMNDESGIVIEGHDLEPMVRQPWHPPHYQRLMEDAGLAKAMDLYMWRLSIADREKMLPVMFDPRRRGEREARRRPAQDDPPPAAQGHGRLRRDLQPGVVAQLGLRALRQGRPRRLRAGPAARLLAPVVHGRREGRRPDRDRHHDPGRQPGAQEDEGAPAPARLVALPAPGEDDRPRPRRLPGRQAPVPAHRGRRAALRRALRPRRGPSADQVGARWAGSSRPTRR